MRRHRKYFWSLDCNNGLLYRMMAERKKETVAVQRLSVPTVYEEEERIEKGKRPPPPPCKMPFPPVDIRTLFKSFGLVSHSTAHTESLD